LLNIHLEIVPEKLVEFEKVEEANPSSSLGFAVGFLV